VSLAARLRRPAHARWDSLERSAVLCHVALVTVKSACHIHSRWRADCRRHHRSGQPDSGQELALASSPVAALRQKGSPDGRVPGAGTWSSFFVMTRVSSAHGRSTSMNCTWSSGYAKSVGVEYTRYADDLAFSGNEAFERCVDRFSTHVAAILLKEGFAVHFRKTRVRISSRRPSLTAFG